MPNVTPDPYNEIIPPSAGKPYGNKPAPWEVPAETAVGKVKQLHDASGRQLAHANRLQILINDLQSKIEIVPKAGGVKPDGVSPITTPTIVSVLSEFETTDKRFHELLTDLENIVKNL